MSARWIQSAGFALFTAAAFASPCVSQSFAGPITPGSIFTPPAVISSPVGGQVVAQSAVIIDQYHSLGIDGSMFASLSAATLVNIGGVTTFAPVSASSSGYTLNFNSFIGMQIVHPINDEPATRNSVTVEFIGLNPNAGYLYAMSPGGGILGATLSDDGIGPNGGFLATLNIENIAAIAMWAFPPGTSERGTGPWGIASIEFDKVVTENPEPATVSMACAGIIGAFGMTWRRRRATRS